MNKKILGSCLVALTLTTHVKPASNPKFEGYPLHELAKTNNAKALKETGHAIFDCILNEKDQEGKTALYIAVLNSNTDVAKVFIATPGVDVTLADNNGFTPLHLAAATGNVEIVKLLLARNIDSDPVTLVDGYTPLHLAMIENHFFCAQELLNNGQADSTFEIQNGQYKGHNAVSLSKIFGKPVHMRKLFEPAEPAPAPEAPSNFSLLYPSTWFSSSAPVATPAPAADQPAQQ